METFASLVLTVVEAAVRGLGSFRSGGLPRVVVVPAVVGLSVVDARWRVVRARLLPVVVRTEERPEPVMGVVVGQEPAVGVEVRRGSEVRLLVAHPRAVEG